MPLSDPQATSQSANATAWHNRPVRMDEIILREYTGADFAAFVEAQSFAFSRLALGVYSQAQLAAVESVRRTDERANEMLEMNEHVAVTRGGRVIGGAGWTSQPDEPGAARIRRVFVHPDFSGRGLGTRLVSEVESRARAQGFERFVVQASLNAVPFYEKLGYRARRSIVRNYGDISVSFVFMGKS